MICGSRMNEPFFFFFCKSPESMNHLEDEEETRHLFELPDSTIAVIGVDRDFNDS